MIDWPAHREQFLRDYYREVDNMREPLDLERVKTYLDRHTDDVVITLGNQEPIRGKAALGEAIRAAPPSPIVDSTHTLVGATVDGDTTVLEFLIDYTLDDGREITIPCASVLDFRGGLVHRLRVYLDLAPVFAPAQ
jgi:ketosteroid isomerase-like protein